MNFFAYFGIRVTLVIDNGLKNNGIQHRNQCPDNEEFFKKLEQHLIPNWQIFSCIIEIHQILPPGSVLFLKIKTRKWTFGRIIRREGL